MADYTEEELQAHAALCEAVQGVLALSTYDQAFMALVSVTAQLCTQCDNEAEMCLTICEDLLAEFRDRMERRSAETTITLPSQN